MLKFAVAVAAAEAIATLLHRQAYVRLDQTFHSEMHTQTKSNRVEMRVEFVESRATAIN